MIKHTLFNFNFNILLERAQQRRDPNYKHTITVHH